MLQVYNRVSNQNHELNVSSFRKEDTFSYFHLESDSTESVSVQVPYRLKPNATYENQEFICHAFYTDKFYRESDIYQVYDKKSDVRIGWIFPIQALLSTEHEYADNIHFLKYAYIAFKNLLTKNINCSINKLEIDSDELKINLDQIYDSSTIILCLCEEQLKKVSNFSIDNYIPSLFINRYYFIDGITENKVNSVSVLDNDDSDFIVKKRHLLPLKESLLEENYIKFIFKKYLSSKQHPLVNFHLLYQIIELLIEKMLSEDIQEIVRTAPGKEPIELKDALLGALTESKRIGKLFSSNVQYHTHPDVYKTAFNDFLKEFDKEDVDLSSSIYKTRNIIVHQYREIINRDLLEKITKINKAFEEIVIALILE